MLSEERAKRFFEQMVNAVDYCHRRWACSEFYCPRIIANILHAAHVRLA